MVYISAENEVELKKIAENEGFKSPNEFIDEIIKNKDDILKLLKERGYERAAYNNIIGDSDAGK